MSIAVKVGQVWRDKDKRRNTVIEIISTHVEQIDGGVVATKALGLVVGTEEEREYSVDRLVKRWELVQDKPDFNEGQSLKLMEPSPEEIEASLKSDLDEFVNMTDGKKTSKPRKAAPRNYHLLMQCPVNGEDGQQFRITQKQLDSFGAPLCGCHRKPMNLIETH